jgi:hypothetical protein
MTSADSAAVDSVEASERHGRALRLCLRRRAARSVPPSAIVVPVPSAVMVSIGQIETGSWKTKLS